MKLVSEPGGGDGSKATQRVQGSYVALVYIETGLTCDLQLHAGRRPRRDQFNETGKQLFDLVVYRWSWGRWRHTRHYTRLVAQGNYVVCFLL